jgi:predicted DNA-binding antitoxin AbrB/MazE fold protein
MSHQVEATYENGVLKLDQPLPLRDGQRVQVTVVAQPSRAARSAGLVKWTGSLEDLDYLTMSPENEPWERE